MTDVVESWKWRDPAEIIDELMWQSKRKERRGEAISVRPHKSRDRYYTQAKRLRIKNLMKGMG